MAAVTLHISSFVLLYGVLSLLVLTAGHFRLSVWLVFLIWKCGHLELPHCSSKATTQTRAVGLSLDMIIRVTKHSSLVIHHRLYLALARSFVTSQVLPNWAGSGHRRVQLTAAEERWTSDDWPWPRTISEQ